MRIAIDATGRIVVPKPLRDELGLGPGAELDIEVRDGALELRPPGRRMWLEQRDGHLVAASDAEIPALTADAVRDTLERVRR